MEKVDSILMLYLTLPGLYMAILRPDGLARQAEVKDYCEDESFVASCDEGEAIVVESALYGRMKTGRCVSAKYGVIGCAVDVRTRLDQWCSGRRTCEVEVTDLLRGTQEHCPKDFRSYLEASYTCVKVITGVEDVCRSGGLINVPAAEGYISSLVAEDTGCGNIDAPWVIQVSAGQKINLTLWDFSLDLDSGDDLRSSVGERGTSVCHVYAILKDRSGSTSTTLCGGNGHRVSHAYFSQANVLEIRVVSKRQEERPGYFLLHYQAVGCADIVAPKGGYVQNEGLTATIGCYGNRDEWRVTCRNNKWEGAWGNCSEGLDQTGQATSFWSVVTSSHGLSIVIIVGVAILVGLLILIAGLFCLRWQRNQRARRMEEYPSSTYGRASARFPGSYIPPEGSITSSEKARDMDPYSGGENNYYRTWQMQNHANKQAMSKPSQTTPPAYNTMGANTLDNRKSHCVEHVYESPKFERRDLPGIGFCSVDNTPTQYFELDPDIMKAPNGPKCLPANCGSRPSVSTNASEPDVAWRPNEERPERIISSR